MWCTCAHCGSEFYCEPEDFPKFGGGSSGRQDEDGHVYDTDVSLYFCCNNCWETYMEPMWAEARAERSAAEAAMISNHNEKLSDCIYIDGAYYSKDRETLVEISRDTQELVIPDGVKYINTTGYGDAGWELTSLVMPDSIIEIKNEGAFSTSPNLVSVRLSKNLKIIPDRTFAGGIKEIKLPEGLKEIGFDAFSECAFSTLEIPDTVKKIGGSAFSGCENLTSVKLPKGLKKIEENLFRGCEALSDISIPESVEEIGESAFSGCSSLTISSIPDSVRKIDSMAFSGCKFPKSLKLPRNLESLNSIFYNLGNSWNGIKTLKNIIIPATLQNIDVAYGRSVFEGCSSLKRILFYNGEPSQSVKMQLKEDLKSKYIPKHIRVRNISEDKLKLLLEKNNKHK